MAEIRPKVEKRRVEGGGWRVGMRKFDHTGWSLFDRTRTGSILALELCAYWYQCVLFSANWVSQFPIPVARSPLYVLSKDRVHFFGIFCTCNHNH